MVFCILKIECLQRSVFMTGGKENQELRILSAIGIILVAAGHLGYDLFDIGGLFPY